MTLTTSTITGRVPLPDDANPTAAEIVFTLSGYDTEGSQVIPGGAKARFVLDNGELPVGAKLWRNTAGLRGTVYEVEVSWSEAGRRETLRRVANLGVVQVADEASYTLTELLNATPVPVPGNSYWRTITQEEYDAVIGAAALAAAYAQQPEGETIPGGSGYSALHHAAKAAGSATAAETAATASQDAQALAETAAANAQASALTLATWSALSALTGTVAGAGAEVLDTDTGTHTDPVVGGTVSNAGRYTWSASPAGWQRIGDTGLSGKASAAVASAFAQNERSDSFRARDVFVADEVKGALSADLSTVAHSAWSVDADGAIDLTGSLPTSISPLSFWAGHRYRAGQMVDAEVEIELVAGFTATHGPMLAFGGDGGTVKFLIYTNTGVLALANGSMVNEIVRTLPTAMQFTNGERPRLRVILKGDGTGMAEAIAPSGKRSRMALTGLPTAGKICATWRRAPSSGKITAFSVRDYDAAAPEQSASTLAKLGLEGDIFRSPVNNTISSATRMLFDGNQVVVTVAPDSNNHHLKTRYSRTADVAWEYFVEVEVTSSTTASSCGAIIAIGDALNDASGRRTYAYLENGFLGRLDNSANTVTGEFTTGAPTFAVNDRAALRIVVLRDGTGFLEAIGPDGTRLRSAVEGVPEGAVWIGWRSTETGVIHRFSATPVSDEPLSSGQVAGQIVLRATVNLPTPDSLSGRSPAGFTCTGGDRYDFGSLSGLIVAGDDGRLTEGDGSPFNRALHFLTPSFGRVVKTLELDPESFSSVQGVAIDRGLYLGTLWVCTTSGYGVIRNYQPPSLPLDGGAETATENSSRAITWGSGGLGKSGTPNGLAFDSDHGSALWVSSASAAEAVQVSIAGKSILRTITLGANPDQLQFLSASQMADGQARLVYTNGNNGSNGTVRVYNLATDDDAVWTVLPGSTAIEQAFYDPATNVLWVLNDRGFHDTGADSDDPANNNVKFYTMPGLPV